MSNLEKLKAVVAERVDENTLVTSGNHFYLDMHMWSKDSREHDRFKRNPRGTVGCILGLIQLVTLSSHTVRSASEWLGIDLEQAKLLIRPPSDMSWTSITLPVVEDALQHLIDGGKMSDFWKEHKRRKR